MYCTSACPFCQAAERLLLEKGVQIDKVRGDLEPARRAQVQPQLEVQINTSAENFTEGYYEVTVTATVTARLGERTLFLAEAQQAGIFALRGVPAEELGPLLGIACPSVVYPYLRETIADMITRAGFPPVILAPLSFEALYLQQQQNAAPTQLGPRIEVARN